MKRSILSILLFLSAVSSAHALTMPSVAVMVMQTAGGHSVAVTWQPSTDAAANPTLSYNVYRASGTCTTATSFTKVDSTAAGILAFTDTAVSVGQSFSYEVTSVLNGLEGAPSNCATAVLLPAAPVISVKGN